MINIFSIHSGFMNNIFGIHKHSKNSLSRLMNFKKISLLERKINNDILKKRCYYVIYLNSNKYFNKLSLNTIYEIK